jgi:Effector-associated domain 2
MSGASNGEETLRSDALGGPMFETALVAWIVAVLADQTLARGRAVILGKPEQVALQAALRLACKALLDDVPASAREPLARALAERLSDPPAIAFDGVSSVTDFLLYDLKLRIAPLADPSITPSGKSYFDELGVDGAAIVDQLPLKIVRSIQQAATRFPQLHALSTQINADLLLDRVNRILDAVQPSAARSLQQVPSGAPPRHQPSQSRTHQHDILRPLITAIRNVPSMADPNTRAAIISTLSPDLRDAIPRNQVSNVEILNTIRTCRNYPGGLRELVSAIRLIEGESRAMANLDATVLQIGETTGIDLDD